MSDHSQTAAAAPSTLDVALAYGAKGFRVFPLRWGTKLPDIKEWQIRATADAGTIEAWFGSGSRNVGMACGPQPNGLNLFAIDVDTKNEGRENWARLLDEHRSWNVFEGTAFHHTPSKGLHLFTDAPDELRNSRGRLAPGIDTRGDGGYVVVPPSTLVTDAWTRHYASHQGSGLLDRWPIVLPAWCLDLLTVTPIVPSQPRRAEFRHDETSPFDWVRENRSWPDALSAHGWTVVKRSGDDTTWRRPGKTDRGGSATLHGSGPLVVWTTDVPIELEGLGKQVDGGAGFSVSIGDFVCAYEYGGDRQAMAREIGRRINPARTSAPPLGGPRGGADGPADMALLPSEGYLSDEFWGSRPILGEIRQAARARRVGPDAVLLNVLVRFAALVPPNYWLPPLVGSYGSLDLLGCVVGVTGIGKSRAMSCSKDIVPPLDQGVRWDLPLGSGEGIPQAYMVPKVDDNGKATKEQVVGFRAAHFIVDEGVAMAKQGGRSGATVIPTINSAITGEGLGQVNASAETRRIIPAGTVRFACVMNIQEENAHLVFSQEMVSIGFTGRLIFAKAGDPTAPDEPPDWPEIVLPRLPIIASGVTLTYHPDIVAEIDAARLAILRLNTGEGTGDSHAMLLRCKISSLLALIDGRRNVELSDWAIAGALIDNSAGVFRSLEALRRNLDSRAVRAIGHRRADIEEVVSERADIKADARRREWVIKQVLRSEDGLTIGELRRRAESKDRPYVEDSVEAALLEERIKRSGERYTK